MKVLVDTSVWIDFFSAQPNAQVVTLENLIQERQDLCICGLILTEVFQGIRQNRELVEIRRIFEPLIYLPMDRSTFEKAANIYRDLRKKGITIRNSIDCLIAAVAIEQEVVLLHSDRDFHFIEKYFQLTTMA